MNIPHSRPTIDAEDIKVVSDTLISGQIAQGERVREFENKITEYIGTKYGIAVSSGTSALHLALLTLKIGVQDEVIVPSYVCSSPYQAILQTGAQPKFVDINFSDSNISATSVKKALTKKTKAIIVPHMFGTPAEINELLELQIPIIEDCAQSIGAEYNNHKAGSFGTLAIFSFYATKMITTGEGGMILTDDQETYLQALDLREYDKKPLDKTRYNYKMTDIQASLGLSQLKKLEYFINCRRKIAEKYNDLFSNYNITYPNVPSHKKSVFYRYVIMLSELEHVQKTTRKYGIMCEKPIWEPLHKSQSSIKCPNTDYVYDHALSIPIYPSLTEDQIEYLIKIFKTILSKIKEN